MEAPEEEGFPLLPEEVGLSELPEVFPLEGLVLAGPELEGEEVFPLVFPEDGPELDGPELEGPELEGPLVVSVLPVDTVPAGVWIAHTVPMEDTCCGIG